MTPEERISERNRLFLVGLLPALVVLFIAAQLFLLTHGNRSARGDYDDGDYPAAEKGFLGLRDFGVVEPWVARFNAGTAAYQDKAYADAVKHFERALEDVPSDRVCLVRVDLALTHQAAAEVARKESRAAAQLELRKAREAVDVFNCDEDLLAELDQAIQKLDTGGGAASPDEQLTEKEKLDELEKRNEQARKRKQEKPEPTEEPDVVVHW